MGLFDMLGATGDSGALYGDLLNPQQKQALVQRGLLGFLGGMAPYMGASRLPVQLGQVLAGGAGGMGQAEDSAVLNAMRANQLGLQGQLTQSTINLRKDVPAAIQQGIAALLGGQGGGNPAAPSPAVSPDANAPTGAPSPSPAAAGPPGQALPPSSPSIAAPDLGGGLRAGSALLPPGLSAAVERVESGSNPNAVSPAGAVGLRQIMPSTAAGYGVPKAALFDPGVNRQLGDTILGDLYKRYNGDLDATLVAYNGGPGTANKWLASGRNPAVLPAETRAYVPKVEGLLAQAATAPAGGLLAGGLPQGGSTPNSAPAPAAGAPSLVPGGGFNIGPIINAEAIGALAGVPGIGQMLMNTPQYQAAVATAKQHAAPPILRQGSVLPEWNAQTGQYGVGLQAPRLPEGTSLALGPNGSMVAQPVPGALKAVQDAAAAQKIGEAQGNTLQQRNDVLKEEYQKNVVEPFNHAQAAQAPLMALQNATANVTTGPTAANKIAAARAWQDVAPFLGIQTGSDLAKWIASGEIINKEGNTLGFELARSLGSRESQMIIQQAIKSNPNIGNSPQGNQMLLNLIQQGLGRDIDKRSFVDNWFNKNLSYDGATDAFNRAAPVSRYVSQVLPMHPASPADLMNYAPGTRYMRPGDDKTVYRVPASPNGG